MTVRAGGMHPLLVTAGDRAYVMVVPPEGVADPEQTWQRFVRHYVQDGEP